MKILKMVFTKFFTFISYTFLSSGILAFIAAMVITIYMIASNTHYGVVDLTYGERMTGMLILMLPAFPTLFGGLGIHLINRITFE